MVAATFTFHSHPLQGAMARLTDVQKGQIIALHQEVYCISAIARRLGFSKSTVRLWVNRYLVEGHVNVWAVPGRLHITTPEQDQQLSTDNHFLTSKDIRGQLEIDVSRKTIFQRLGTTALYARWAAKKKSSLLPTYNSVSSLLRTLSIKILSFGAKSSGQMRRFSRAAATVGIPFTGVKARATTKKIFFTARCLSAFQWRFKDGLQWRV